MSKIPPLSFRREDIPDLSTGERTDRLLRGLNAFGAEAEKTLNGGLTFRANFRAFSKVLDIITPASGFTTIRIKNELGVDPLHVWVTHAVEYTTGTEVPVVVGGIAWTLAKDQIVISGVGDVSASKRYRVRILVAAE